MDSADNRRIGFAFCGILKKMIYQLVGLNDYEMYWYPNTIGYPNYVKKIICGMPGIGSLDADH